MTEPPSATALQPAAIDAPVGGSVLPAVGAWPWKPALTVFAVAAAGLALWVTARAEFLAHPGWLAVQKADFILGPVLVGLYWLQVRPASRFGWLLIVLGLLGVPYILESSSDPTLFALGVVAEDPSWLMLTFVILAFPSGRLEGLPERLVFAAFVVAALAVVVVTVSTSHLAPGLSISQCRDACPGSSLGLSEWRTPDRVIGTLPVVISLAIAGVVGWRFATGTPPRRRALAIGTPIALLFLLVQGMQQALVVISPGGASPIDEVVNWTLAGTRAGIWYGFLFALIAAQLFAGRVLREVVGASTRRPSVEGLERLLRVPLGDPGLRIGFWRPRERDFAGTDGDPLEPSQGQALTPVERDGRPAAAIVHDTQLSDHPELLAAAAGVLLLAGENTELERAWHGSLRELTASRARLSEASDRERRKLERDLHDGAQQRLMAIQIKLRMAEDRTQDQRLADELEAIGADAEQAVEELRMLAHGIYPPVLRSYGLAEALRASAMTAPIAVVVEDDGTGRCPRTIEAAIYFCAMEAIQNVIKHAGEAARVTITLGRDRRRVRFAIADDGVGMAEPASRDGEGLIGMRDRIGAVGGELEIVSAPGAGTTVRGTVPLDGGRATRAREVAG
jgi:signal transduction histidine kinase